MGKRKRDVTENYELIAYKIKKLEQKLMHTRRRDRQRNSRSRRLPASSSSDLSRSSSSSSISSSSSSRSGLGQAGATDRELPPEILCIEGIPISSTSTTTAAATAATPLPSTSTGVASEFPPERIIFLPGTSTTSPENNKQSSAIEPVGTLDDELLLILGEDPSLVRSFGEDIQLDLASRLQHIATTGLPKEIRKDLMDKYLPPANCTLIEAPTLNPEVVATVPEAVLKRDKKIELRQKQRTSVISCVARALTLLMSSEPRDTALIQMLMDAIKLMCDSQNTDSSIRRNFVLNTLKKDIKDHLLQATKINYCENLADTLKAAKAISKSEADLKKTPSKQQFMKTKQPQKNLNWRGPPQNHRQKGTQRTKQPADKGRTDRSSRPSSRPAKYRCSNRN